MERKVGIVLVLVFVCCDALQWCSPNHYEEQILAKVVQLEKVLKRIEEKVDKKEKVQEDCPDSWIRFKSSCYLFEEEKYSFLDAKSHCQRLCANLVHINDFAENEFLQNHVKTLTKNDFWIGLEDIDREGVFKWVDDDTTPSFKGWYRLQPDNYGNEDCVHFKHSYKYNWNDAPCHFVSGSICEKKAKV